jgi:hypothetical protein
MPNKQNKKTKKTRPRKRETDKAPLFFPIHKKTTMIDKRRHALIEKCLPPIPPPKKAILIRNRELADHGSALDDRSRRVSNK